MEFCDDCGANMKTDGDKWVCSCGFEKPRDEAKEVAMVTTEGETEGEIVDISDTPQSKFPIKKVDCDECGNDEAYYNEMSGGPEDQTVQVFRCTECENSWKT